MSSETEKPPSSSIEAEAPDPLISPANLQEGWRIFSRTRTDQLNIHSGRILTSADKASIFKAALRNDYVAYFPQERCYLNLSGRYDYLERGYYISLDLERADKRIHPTCKEILDAYVTPLLLEKAKLSGLLIPEYYITNGYFEPPVILDTINPFMQRSSVILKAGHRGWLAKSMTRNYTYAVCCQELPDGSQVRHFRSILGWCSSRRFRELSESIWQLFHIPLAKVRVIVTENGGVLLSDISQLPFERLSALELSYLRERIIWEE